MSGLTAAKAIRAVIRNKDAAALHAEDKMIFGIYEPAYDFIVEYYDTHEAVPTESILQAKFGDDFWDQVPETDGPAAYYMNELRESYLRENISRMIQAVSDNIDEKTPVEILDKMSVKVAELSRFTSRSRDVDITDVDDALKHFEDVRKKVALGKAGIMTGICVWDEFVPGGLEPGMNTVLIGYSGRAKSWVADLIVANAYAQGKKVLFISLEMNEHQQRARIWAILAKGNFTMRELQTGEASEEKIRDFADDHLSTGGYIKVVDKDGMGEITPNVIRAKIDKYKPDLVVIDYLQLMSDNAKSREMTPRMLNLSKEIKRLAVMTDLPIITISAVTDDESKKQNLPPTGQQVAWSKGIMYDADLVVAVHKYEDSDIVELICRKSRNGELFAMRFRVDLGRGVFEPVMDDDDQAD